nr:MAG TPA: hypothetical protein [Caudoviricetes sp.]
MPVCAEIVKRTAETFYQFCAPERATFGGNPNAYSIACVP